MLDIDPQASLFTWFNPRRRAWATPRAVSWSGAFGLAAGQRARSAAARVRLLVIDDPAQAETDARSAIRAADLALLPCQPNALDLWACKTPSIWPRRRGPTRAGAQPGARARRAAEAIRAEIEGERWPLAAANLGNRQAFAASIGRAGRGRDAPSSSAKRRIAALAARCSAGWGLRRGIAGPASRLLQG